MKCPLSARLALYGALVLVIGSCHDTSKSGGDVPPLVAISPAGAEQDAFAFSSDGKRIAYWQRGTGSTPIWELWVANADHSSPLKLPAIMAVSAGNVPPVWSPDNRHIAAATSQFGGTDIIVVPSAGGDARRITTGVGAKWPIAWHAEGKHLDYVTYTSGGRWAGYVASLDSGASVASVPGERRSYTSITSPDGLRVAYQLTDGARSTIWVADRDGANARQLTTDGFESLQFYGQRPWSPDGKSLVYESRRTGKGDIWVVPVDSGAPRQLTRDIASDVLPTWSPDGRVILFRSNRGRQTDVWIVPAAGGVEQRVTDTPAEELVPVWVDDGTIAFADASSVTAIWTIDVTSGAERRISPDTARVSAFLSGGKLSMSAGARMFAYRLGGLSAGIDDIIVTREDGSEQRRLTDATGDVGNLSLSPDGARVAFSSFRGGSNDIWVVDVATRALRRVTDWPGAEFSPSWSPDGKSIYFLSNRDARGADIWRISADSGGTAARVTRSGGFNGMHADRRLNAIMANVRDEKAGHASLAVVAWDGSMRIVWDSSASYYASVSPSGDSIAAVVQLPNGQQESRILPARGQNGRAVLQRDEHLGAWSNNGRWLLYNYAVGGFLRLGVLDLSNGSTRRLALTPGYDDRAYDALWTTDDRSVVIERRKPNSRVYTVDVSRLR